MDYKISDIEKLFHVKIIENSGNGELVIKINDNEHSLKILNIGHDDGMIDFILDQKYHKVKYLKHATNEMNIVIDNLPITINMHINLDKIVYKNSGGATSNTQITLKSQIPGKVVSIIVKVQDVVKKGDPVCVLESMKMQVTIKAHKDGVIKSINIRESNSVAKGDIIAEIDDDIK